MIDDIVFRSSDGYIRIHSDKLPEVSITKLRKVFGFALSWAWTNRDAIQAMPALIAEEVAKAQDTWRISSEAYVGGWKLGGEHDRLIAKNNKHLIADVKRAKAAFDRWEKIRTIWEITAQKYQM